MSTIRYFQDNGAHYKISLDITQVCSPNMVYKRTLKDIKMAIYKGGQKLYTQNFKSGFWMPSQEKFYFKTKNAIENDCFEGASNLSINLKTNTLNTVKGHYLNLSSGKSLKLTCTSL
jgi:hypothetical protein